MPLGIDPHCDPDNHPVNPPGAGRPDPHPRSLAAVGAACLILAFSLGWILGRRRRRRELFS